MHPGIITTDLLFSLFRMRGDSPEHAAANLVHVATIPEHVNGRYYDERRPKRPNPIALDPETQRRPLAVTTARVGDS